ncbi:hypothetical protein J3E64_003327 [Sphingobium sp. OAS761]|uniref:alginate export family protein n=1 Tax=Sphingobium sp. OAS761 TaxID=2817901 RepID=UPI00209EDEDC|nr:alginate export family protein [Sphingobium sp. OAS761]MCP1471616.1 hypothetical protein [Sphingobium sp. OAS761]
MKKIAYLGTALAALAVSPALAKTYPVGEGLTLTPSIDARLRYEHVDQDNALDNAGALTVRVRPGLTLGTSSGFSVLVEGEGLLAISEKYNSTTNGKTGFSAVPDPQNIELNRAQIQYKGKGFTLTGGRQRINLDDQRFVGSVGWRQNEQTFDAVTGEATVGPVMLNATYAWSDRTIFGIDAGPREAFSGNYFFLGAGAKAGPVTFKAFSYLLDQDEAARLTMSSQTYGLRAGAALPISKIAKLSLTGSYAHQSDYQQNPVSYSADYYMGEVALSVRNVTLTGNYEVLGSDKGAFAFQTPLATGHKFQGWADLFLTTPAKGVRDLNAGLSAKFPKQKALPGLNAAVIYHDFRSDVGSLHYGTEWDAQIGFKVWKTALLLKYADYNAKAFGVDTKKLWIQLDWAY